ncbi:asparagine synthase-related protein [Streptomyces olivaceus]|uniref:asparagine synthase-related protein n=1 Tax=Streptomyces olivaceus TaxID=47716 RepID=UPI003639CC35
MARGDWFVVLPDGDAAAAAARALRPVAPQVLRHTSGRPWLFGCWPQDMVVSAQAGPVRVVVAGECAVTAPVLSRALARVRSLAEAREAAAGLAGSFHLFASVGGRVWAQGTLAAVRRVFHARVGDAVVACNRPEVLARLSGAGWDGQWLALRLSGMVMPFPLHESVPWEGVEPVAADEGLVLEADGRARTVRRWQVPEPDASLSEGAAAVRTALSDAVEARTAGRSTVSTDLSGGMDSSSLAFLAAGGATRLVTYRFAESDVGNDDAHYARLSAGQLTGARHVVDGAGSVPAMFAGLQSASSSAGGAGSEPFGWVRSRARLKHLAKTMASAGSRLHLAGHGGDEVFRTGSHTHLHDLVRRSPLSGWGRVRDYRAMARVSWSAALRQLADGRTPGQEVTAQARELQAGPLTRGGGWVTGWAGTPVMPVWASEDAVEAARVLLSAVAGDGCAPLARWREQHEVLLLARCTGTVVAQADRLTRQVAGVGLEVPFLDDAVLRAALAVHPGQRNQPGRYKPLLAEAMHGTVPLEVLSRRTKGEFSADFYQGWQRHRGDILALLEDSRLARHGLIDTDRARRALLRPHTSALDLAPLDATLATEVWLREAESNPLRGSVTERGESRP